MLDFLQMCANADIPIHKTAAIVPFLKKHCQIGGAVPGETQLRKTYVPMLWAEHIKKLKTLLAGRTISLEVDETTDNRAQQVFGSIVNRAASLLHVGDERHCNCRRKSLPGRHREID